MKDTLLSSISAEELLEFQPNLASALFRLDEMYQALAEERTTVIARKKVLSLEWIGKRLRTIAAYQKAFNNEVQL
jgi:hypothetical protein